MWSSNTAHKIAGEIPSLLRPTHRELPVESSEKATNLKPKIKLEKEEQTQALALLKPDGGPTTPEVNAFTPHDANNLVDPFTGDFSFNIPLLDVGGYPINLAYRSAGVTPEEEASFVGLGWNLNPGSISRQVRGLPDDLNGEAVKKTMNLKDEENIGINTGFSVEVTGLDVVKFGGSFQLGINHNNYHGFELEASIAPSISSKDESYPFSASLQTSFGVSSRSGAFFEPQVGFSANLKEKEGTTQAGLGIGARVGSVEGLESINFHTSLTRNLGKGKHVEQSLAGISLNFARPTYTPTFEMPQTQVSGSLSLKLGGELSLINLGGSIGGFYSKKFLTTNTDSVPAYGYAYAHNAGVGKVLLDVNREKDGAYIEENPNLPLTNFTYDLYHATGQGFSEQFRPRRGDIGTVFDTERNNQDGGGKISAEIGLGNLIHGGVDVAANYHNSETKKWQDGNGLNEKLYFRGPDPENPAFEPVYFKGTGEQTILQNEALFHETGAFEPVAADLNKGHTGECSGNLIANGLPLPARSDYRRLQREPRNQNLLWLTAGEAKTMGFQRQILSEFTLPNGTKATTLNLNRDADFRKAHHFSEATITRDDGVRYVYGLPVYNTFRKEVSFSTDSLPDPVTNLAGYVPGVDNSLGNKRGDSNYFSAEETPPHAYAYLLTAVLSADYIDTRGDGPTPDDLGTYTKFNYFRVYERFPWRIPFEAGKAVFNAAHDCDPKDNLASYTYGEKEIWYISSVETRNYVAEFTLNPDRQDALGATNENGGSDGTRRLLKLDKVALYAMEERQRSGAAAVPIKSVFFEYDYALSPGHPASLGGQGKLTLKRLSFSYGNSEKERLSPYEFFYDHNPAYRANRNDRWAIYKEPVSAALDNERFPYAVQDKTTADRNASAWLLSRIKMPSGDTLSISYEADDYAFVQNKRAMEMAPLTGCARSPNGAITDSLYADKPYEYFFFKTKSAVSTDEDVRKYVDGITTLYFNCMTKIRNKPVVDSLEAIGGFTGVSFKQAGVDFGRRDNNTAWIKVPAVKRGDDIDPAVDMVNPVSKTAWQTLRKDLSKFMLEGPGSNGSPGPEYNGKHDDPTKYAEEVLALFENLSTFFNDIYSELRRRGIAKIFKPGKSFVRLNCPDGFKRGGGSRVKRLRVNDAWGTMQQAEPGLNFDYIQEYTYTNTASDGYGSSATPISSGVASYEPMIGGDENPFALPINYTVHKEFAINLFENIIQPFGESFFPARRLGTAASRCATCPSPAFRPPPPGAPNTNFIRQKISRCS